MMLAGVPSLSVNDVFSALRCVGIDETLQWQWFPTFEQSQASQAPSLWSFDMDASIVEHIDNTVDELTSRL